MRKQGKHWTTRMLATKRAGMLVAGVLALFSLTMIVSNFQIVSFQATEGPASRPADGGGSSFFTSVRNAVGENVMGPEDTKDREQMRKFLNAASEQNFTVSHGQSIAKETSDPTSGLPVSHGAPFTSRAGPSMISPPIAPHHPCEGFALPPPPADKKRTGPRPCPVCYLPVEQAIRAMPPLEATPTPVLKRLTYLQEPNSAEFADDIPGSEFGGHPTLQERRESHRVQEHMEVFCGFVKGSEPGVGTGFDISDEDRRKMRECKGVVVGSAIFGNYDELQQPKNSSKEAQQNICFFMFIDEETGSGLNLDVATQGTRILGLWNVVIVHNLPYSDARRNGKIPKLLLHRLFPHARFSLWVDGKLELVVDPYQILERFLWRRNNTFAISKHYARFDVFVEAEANKAAGKYDNATIDAQVDFYRSEGMTPYTARKLPVISDVPEGCVIVREHTPLTNLLGCLWFNEVDRFTSRDQLSFAIIRDKILAQVPWRADMFLDCERRNFVVQGYHRDVLTLKALELKNGTNNETADVKAGLQYH